MDEMKQQVAELSKRVDRLDKIVWVVSIVAGIFGLTGAGLFSYLASVKTQVATTIITLNEAKAGFPESAANAVEKAAKSLLSDFWIVEPKASTKGTLTAGPVRARYCALSRARITAAMKITDSESGGTCEITYLAEAGTWTLTASSENQGNGSCQMACFGKL